MEAQAQYDMTHFEAVIPMPYGHSTWEEKARPNSPQMMLPAARIQLSPAPGYSSGEAIAAIEQVASEVLEAGHTYEWTNMAYQEKLSGDTAQVALVLALIFIYLFLVGQYEFLESVQ